MTTERHAQIRIFAILLGFMFLTCESLNVLELSPAPRWLRLQVLLGYMAFTFVYFFLKSLERDSDDSQSV